MLVKFREYICLFDLITSIFHWDISYRNLLADFLFFRKVPLFFRKDFLRLHLVDQIYVYLYIRAMMRNLNLIEIHILQRVHKYFVISLVNFRIKLRCLSESN